MEAGLLIPISMFATIFGIVYLYFSTRNKERLALIEKGMNASIFKTSSTSIQTVLLLNLSLLFIGIGIGVFMALLIVTYTSLEKDAVYPAIIFLMAGISLFIGFTMTKKLEK